MKSAHRIDQNSKTKILKISIIKTPLCPSAKQSRILIKDKQLTSIKRNQNLTNTKDYKSQLVFCTIHISTQWDYNNNPLKKKCHVMLESLVVRNMTECDYAVFLSKISPKQDFNVNRAYFFYFMAWISWKLQIHDFKREL